MNGPRINYYMEAVSEAMSDAGVQATDDQVRLIAEAVYGAADMEHESFGDYNIPHPSVAESRRVAELHRDEVDRLKREIADLRQAIGDRLKVRREDHPNICIQYGILGLGDGRFRAI